MAPGRKIRDQGCPERERLAGVGKQAPLRPRMVTTDAIRPGCRCGRTSLISEISAGHFRGEAGRIAMPGDPAVIEHIDTVRMREGEGDILLRQQKGERGRLAQPLDRLGELAENQRSEPGIVCDACPRAVRLWERVTGDKRAGAKRVPFSRAVKRANVIFPRHVRYVYCRCGRVAAGDAGVAQW